MPEVVGVRFKRACKIYSFDPGGLDLSEGDEVVVETSRGHGFGWVVVGPHTLDDKEVVSPLRQVVRQANEEDRLTIQRHAELAQDARVICERKIATHGLDMQIIDAEYVFDESQLIFYFTADGRVDFRELVRDLAATFHTRIELRQIGVRDEAKLIGGLGPCGRVCCCVSFLDEFAPISIRMAKRQNLSLNPSKISGLCGRLMCCLQYEDETYKEAKSLLPNPGTKVSTSDGVGEVTRVDLLGQTIEVRFDPNHSGKYAVGDFKRVQGK